MLMSILEYYTKQCEKKQFSQSTIDMEKILITIGK